MNGHNLNLRGLARAFWEQGYLVVHDFFSEHVMADADKEIRSYFGDDPAYRHEETFLEQSKTEVIPWFPQNPEMPDYSPEIAGVFDSLERDGRLVDLTGAILGEAWSPLYSMVMFSRKGTVGQAWHQDCPPEDSSRFNLNRLVYTRTLSRDDGGQVVVVPGSHRKGALPPGETHENLENQVVISPRVGSLVLLHGHTWHRVTPIKGDFRFSTNFRACPKGTPDNITDICVYRNMRYRFSTAEVIEER